MRPHPLLAATVGVVLALPVAAHEFPDPAIKHNARDGVVRLYGAGEKDADAWITWPDWPLTHPEKADLVQLSEERRIWRDVDVVLAPDADSEAKQFLDFLNSARGADIMKTEGWVR